MKKNVYQMVSVGLKAVDGVINGVGDERNHSGRRRSLPRLLGINLETFRKTKRSDQSVINNPPEVIIDKVIMESVAVYENGKDDNDKWK